MATLPYLPGVKINEVPLGSPPISGVSTSVAGFVGKAPNTTPAADTAPVLVTSVDDFVAKYVKDPGGDPTKDATRSTSLSRAVFGFFNNGGFECYVVNVKEEGGGTASAAVKGGIDLLGRSDAVQIIAAPGSWHHDTNKALSDQAELLKDRVAILEADPASTDADLIAGGGKRPADSKFAALYFPRILVGPDLVNLADAAKGDPLQEAATPVGHIAGVWARVDQDRGVHKAPANEGILGAVGLEVVLTDNEQNPLNKDGVNALRLFSGDTIIWGARTLQGNDAAADPLFRYLSVRRLTNYVEQSLKTGLRLYVFEPNNLALRQRITRSVRGFLDGVWRDGALFGATPADAYYVRFPDAFNRDEDRLAGKLTVEIGLRPAPPAEFIIVRIGILTQSPASA